MILTVTLNPAVDKTCTISSLIRGKVNRLSGTRSIAGGKGVNVTKILRQFDFAVTAMGFLGGYTGRMIEEALKKQGADCRFVHIKGETRVSTNILETDGCVTEILEPGPIVSEQELRSFLGEYDSQLECCELVVLSGSAPKGVPVDIYRRLTELAKARGRKVFLDTSGELLRAAVAAGPYMIKPNRQELEYLSGKRLETMEALEEEAVRLLDKGVEKVVVSMGEDGLLYVDRTQRCVRRPPRIRAVNTVACGDAVVASFCMSELEGRDEETAVRTAVALSAANATTAVSAEIPMDTYLEFLKR